MSLCNYLHKYGIEWHSIMSIDMLSSSYAYVDFLLADVGNTGERGISQHRGSSLKFTVVIISLNVFDEYCPAGNARPT